MTGAFLCVCIFVAIVILAVREERAMRRSARRERAHQRRLERQAVWDSLMSQQGPDPNLRAWTPQEREMLGLNDTIELISRIDKELGAEYAQVKLTPPQHVRITNQEA